MEELWNDLAKTYPFYLRCAYPMSGFDREDHQCIVSEDLRGTFPCVSG